jgi:hypothetical protein
MIREWEEWGFNSDNRLIQIEFYVTHVQNKVNHNVFQARLGTKTQNLYTFGSVEIESNTMTFLNVTKANYFDIFPVAFEIDQAEKFAYFFGYNKERFFINQFSIKEGSLAKSIQNSDFDIINSKLFLNNNCTQIYFTASHVGSSISVICRYDINGDYSDLNWTRFKGYDTPLSTAMIGDSSFISTMLPVDFIDHAMVYKVDFESNNTWISRISLKDKHYFKDSRFGGAIYNEDQDFVYKLSYFKYYIFYALSNQNGTLVSSPISLKWLPSTNSDPWMKLYRQLIYIFPSPSHLLLYNTRTMKFLKFIYVSDTPIRFLSLSQTKVISSNNNNSIIVTSFHSINASRLFRLEKLRKVGKEQMEVVGRESDQFFEWFEVGHGKIEIGELQTVLLNYSSPPVSFNLEPWQMILKVSKNEIIPTQTEWNLGWGDDLSIDNIKVHNFEKNSHNKIKITEINKQTIEFNYYFSNDKNESIFMISQNIYGQEYIKPILITSDPTIEHWTLISDLRSVSYYEWLKCFSGYSLVVDGNLYQWVEIFSFLSWAFVYISDILIFLIYITMLICVKLKIVNWSLLCRFNDFYLHLSLLVISIISGKTSSNYKSIYYECFAIALAFTKPYLTLPFLLLIIFISFSGIFIPKTPDLVSVTFLDIFYFNIVWWLYLMISMLLKLFYFQKDCRKKRDVERLIRYEIFKNFSIPWTGMVFGINYCIAQYLIDTNMLEITLVANILAYSISIVIFLIIGLTYCFSMFSSLWYAAIYGRGGEIWDPCIKTSGYSSMFYSFYFLKQVVMWIIFSAMFPILWVYSDNGNSFTVSIWVSFISSEVIWIVYLLLSKPFRESSIMRIEITNHCILLASAIIFLIYSFHPKDNQILMEVVMIMIVPHWYIIYLLYIILTRGSWASKRNKRKERIKSEREDSFKRNIYIRVDKINDSDTLSQPLSIDA